MRYIDDITGLTVTHDRPYLTKFACDSLFAQLGFPMRVVVVNQGRRNPFLPDSHKSFFTILDNDNVRLISKNPQDIRDLHFPSIHHCSAVSYALDNAIKTRWCMLFDNDVIFKTGIRGLLNGECLHDAIGQIDENPYNGRFLPRMIPFLCIIDVGKMKEDGFHYFRRDTMFPGLKEGVVGGDTGSNFYIEAKNHGWNIRGIRYDDYIRHFVHASVSARTYATEDYVREQYAIIVEGKTNED